MGHVQGRQRGGGYRGRKAMRSFSRGSRGGAPTNSGPQGVATNSQFRGNGRTDQGNFGNGPGFSWIYCWSCNTANPNQNQVCSYCSSLDLGRTGYILYHRLNSYGQKRNYNSTTAFFSLWKAEVLPLF